jgi:Transcriptional regulator containing an amidase domain and an AraC-type DNA-binding HTH domain
MINDVLFSNLEYNMSDYPYSITVGEIHEDYMIHTHDYAELVIILNGEALHIVDDETYKISAGDVYLIREKTAHGFSNVKHLAICNIGIKNDALTVKYPDLKNLPGYQALYVLEPYYRREHQFRSRLHLDYPSLQHVISIINNMNDEYNKKEEGFRSMFVSYLLNIMIYLSRIYPKMKNEYNNKVLTIANAVTHMERCYDKKVRIDELAKKAGVSTRQFNRIFKKNYGVSPVDYLIKLRIDKTALLLSNTDMSIIDIAIENGFCDSTHFARQFKTVLGVTPTAYRKSKNNKIGIE